MVEEASAKAALAKKKKTKLALASDSGRRLVEYFCVISSVEREEKETAEGESGESVNVSFSDWKTESYDDDEESVFSEHKFRPKVTARYPLTDHPDDPLHEQIMFFCHPTGGIQLRLDELMPKVSSESVSSSHYVVHASIYSFSRMQSILPIAMTGPFLCCNRGHR